MNGRMLFGRRSGLGRKTYKCETCGATGRFGTNPELPGDGPLCPHGHGPMARSEPKKKHKGAGKNKPRRTRR